MADTPWCGYSDDKLYLQSGQFTSTVKTSEYVGGVDALPAGISYDGANTPWCGATDDKLYLQSGQFTSTIKDSVYVGGVDAIPIGICTNAYAARIAGAGWSGIILGVSGPAKVGGVDKADIEKITGV